jgi:hypothetical protein
MANGLLDTSTLTPLPAQPHLRLTAAAAAAWTVLVASVWAAYGWTLTATDAYRDYATQLRIFQQRYTTTYLPGRPWKLWQGRRWYLKRGYAAAAVPGTSNHGLGITVDVANLGGFGGTRYRQFAAIAEPRGWSNAEGRAINEAWHWNHLGGGSLVTNPVGGGGSVPNAPGVTAPTPIEEDDMFTDDDRVAAAATRQHAANAEANSFAALKVVRAIAETLPDLALDASQSEANAYRAQKASERLLAMAKAADETKES